MTESQVALLTLLEQCGYAKEPPRYRVTAPGKPNRILVFMDLAMRHYQLTFAERKDRQCS